MTNTTKGCLIQLKDFKADRLQMIVVAKKYIENYFNENLTATQFGSSEFFVRRLEEYERTLCVLTSRIEESYGQEICLIVHLHQLLGILNELRCHFEGTAEEAERDMTHSRSWLLRLSFRQRGTRALEDRG